MNEDDLIDWNEQTLAKLQAVRHHLRTSIPPMKRAADLLSDDDFGLAEMLSDTADEARRLLELTTEDQ